MKKLFENWRKYLIEVSYKDAREILNSKGTLKIIKNYEYQMKELYGQEGFLEPTAKSHKDFKDWLLEAIPDDLTDNQKGTAVLWLRKLAKEDWKVAKAFIDQETYHRSSKYGRLWDDFEAFFHHQRFMPQQDLMSIKTIDDLQRMVDDAKDEIHAAQEKKQYLDAGEGTEVLRDDDEWFIAAIHNKGAACELGKGTNWCTAAPGLDYFSDYYEPDDPLFYFESLPNRKDLAEPAEEKYQFHYGSEQFMDVQDHHVSEEIEKWLHNILMQTEAPKKYPVVQNWHYETIAEDRSTPPEELAALAENPDVYEGILTKVAKNPSTPLETLEKLAKSDSKFIKRAIQVNSALDMGLAIELFVNNPQDTLIYGRGKDDLRHFLNDEKITVETYKQLIDDVDAKRGYKPRAVPTEVANLERIYEHKIKIRIRR